MNRKNTPLETVAETRFVKEVTLDGAICLKLYTKGYNDRLILMDYNTHFFIEFKREGESPRKLQTYRHSELKKRGHETYVCYSYEEAITIYNKYKSKCLCKRNNTTKAIRSSKRKPPIEK